MNKHLMLFTMAFHYGDIAGLEYINAEFNKFPTEAIEAAKNRFIKYQQLIDFCMKQYMHIPNHAQA